MAKRGILISFEGIDGSGKSTQARLLFNYLKQHSFDALFIREPGGTPVSEAIRSILLDNSHKKMNPRTELLLFLASRSELVEKVIGPALQAGKIIITDRFSDSTIAYQVFGRKLPRQIVESGNSFATESLKPDLTFVVDLTTDRAKSRLKNKRDRMELQAESFHKRVRRGFLQIAKSEPRRVEILDGSRTQDDLFNQVWICTSKFLTRKKLAPKRRLAK